MTREEPAPGQEDGGAAAPVGTGHVEGGTIPGASGAAAFHLRAPQPSAIPVLIAVPHAGRVYPPSLVERMRNPGFAALRLEDRYVDRIAHAVAAATGAALLVAQAPRAMIDLNRAADDVDWEMVIPPDGRDPGVAFSVPAIGKRARSGLGLVPRRLPGMGELWKRPLERAELDARIAKVHEPYHTALAQALARLRARWGAALLLDLHSMPPLAVRGGPAPQFVVGDRFGAACDGALVGAAFAWFAENRRLSAHNRPYAGGYVLERHADPRRGIHAFQLEIDRSVYLDSRLAEPGAGLGPTVDLLAGLVQRLAGVVAEQGREWSEAAE